MSMTVKEFSFNDVASYSLIYSVKMYFMVE